MSKLIKKAMKRGAAALMAVLMVLSLLPAPVVVAQAEIIDAVTITVKDEENNPIEGVSVEVVINRRSDETNETRKTLVTDENGQVEVMPNSEYAEDEFIISAIATKEGYQSSNLDEILVTEESQNFDIIIEKIILNEIDDVTVQEQIITYDGNEHDAVVITGLKEDDMVTYSVDGGAVLTEMPKVQNAGTYSITVTVNRAGHEDLVKTVETKVNPADIEIDITANELFYNEESQELVSVSGDFGDSDTVTWKVNEEVVGGREIPKASAVGTYTVVLTVDRGSNYKLLEKEVNVTIAPGAFEVEGVTVKGQDLTYTGEAQDAIEVTVENEIDYDLYYQLDADGDVNTTDDSAWVTEIPKVTNAGQFIVWVKAVKEYYKDEMVEVLPAESAATPYNVYVAKAEQKVEFENEDYKEETSGINVKGVTPFAEQKFDFSATDVTAKGVGTITYELTDASKEFATIDGSEVTVEYPGMITVKAILSGDSNHAEAVAVHVLNVKAIPETEGTYVTFADTEMEYTFGVNTGVVAGQNVTNKNSKDDGVITYSVDKTDIGLSCDANTGEITISDYEALANALVEADDSLEINVTAHKAATDFYGEDSASYKITISFVETPDEPVVITGTKGTIDENETEWYVTGITVAPKEGYFISKDCKEFGENVSFNESGIEARYVYLCDEETGGITNRIEINAKIDREASNAEEIDIEFSELTLIEMIGATLGFYKPNTTITFSAEDVMSGVHHFEWTYTREGEISASNLGRIEDIIVEDGVAEATLTVPFEDAQQLRGKIAVKVCDNAGNMSQYKVDDRVFVIDTVTPECSVSYMGIADGVNAQVGEDGTQYFNGAVKATITITEANFYPEIVTVSVTKDGEQVEGIDVEWENGSELDKNIGSFVLEEDGDYVVTIAVTDKSGNAMESYASETIVIDSTPSSVEFEYDEENQCVTITVDERNFNAAGMDVVAIEDVLTITDITGTELANKDEILEAIRAYIQDEDNWSSVSSTTHKIVLESGEGKLLADAIYNLKLVFTDLAGIAVEKETGAFVVDHTNPTDVTITYSEPTWFDEVLETLTLGFYNPSVEIAFEAYDTLSGIDHFEWKYIKQVDASAIHKPSDENANVVEAVQNATDKTKFTAIVTVSATDAEQIKGSFVVDAVDAYGNSASYVDEENVIIVDTKNPECEVSYVGQAQEVNDVYYFKDNATISFVITEANFYEDCVKVYVANKAEETLNYVEVQPTWAEGANVDEHVGNFEISGEGDYLFKIEATDKTENDMETYMSNVITIDSTAPVVDFEYDVDTQKAVITVTEQNFDPADIAIEVTAKNIKDETVEDDIEAYAQSAKNWVSGANDTHTLVLESGETKLLKDAIYKLTISYKDLALLEAEDVVTESFVVDHTKPVDLAIVYDTKTEKEKLTETILETITLGFYNPTVEITFIAYDYAAGVDYFNWSYTKQKNSSSVNKESDTVEMMESQKVAAVKSESDASKYTATITLPEDEAEQLRGYFTFVATDKYGNAEEFVDDMNIVIVDTKAPTCIVTVNGEDGYTAEVQAQDTKHYFDDEVEVEFVITEANFYEEDVVVTVSKDGTTTIVDPSWSDGATADEHVGTFTLEEDGDYVVTIEATDKAGNEMTDYVSETIVIDTTKPVVEFSYDVESQNAIIKVTEKNFRPAEILVEVEQSVNRAGVDIEANDIQKYAQNAANWTSDGDVHTLVLESGVEKILVDAIYVLVLDYKDLALNDATQVETDVFIVDNSVPTGVTIEYLTNPLEEVLGTVTLGIYKPNVQIKFTAYDSFTEIDYFTWNYTKQNSASSVNRPTDNEMQKVEADVDSNDDTKFTATITVPADEAEQWRGYISVTATDIYGNTSNKVSDDGRIIIVDTIAPEVTVEYSPADKMVDARAYYKNNVTATIKVNEANFFAEDVVVNVSKDGAEATAVTPAWTSNSADEHIGVFTISEDGDYIVEVSYEDKSGNFDKEDSVYSSHEITLDKTAPTVQVTYHNDDVVNTLSDFRNNIRRYFDDVQKATITIKEHNFDADSVNITINAADAAGAALSNTNLYSISKWERGEQPDTYVAEVTYSGNANYTFDITCNDFATNMALDYAADYFTVDKSVPVSLKVSYSTSVLETVLEMISFGFYNAKVDVTVVAEDSISGMHSFAYSYIKASGVSDVNAEVINQTITSANITYSNGLKNATAKFQIPKDVLTSNNQFNGTITFDAIDRAGLKSTFKDNKRIIVDNIAPSAQVTYNNPVQQVDGISYYDDNVQATIVITEANFYANDVVVTVSKDGGTATTVTPTWVDNDANIHTGTFTLNGDGDYVVNISYRDKSLNEMTVYTSEQLTIDTEIEEPSITFNGNTETGHAYKGEIIPSISFSDINLDSYEVALYRTYMNQINVDITASKNINNMFTIDEQSGSATLNIFDADEDGNYDQNDDGIYHLVVTMNDKAGHTIEKDAYFTINRFGSVYAYSSYLAELIADDGAYVNVVTEDLVITEYNADKLVSDSLRIEITKDGKPLDEVKYTSSPTLNDNVSIGDSGWYQYEYVISRENFLADGIYKISISSKDATGNTPENSNYEGMNILFRVDTTVPEITSITGLEDAIVDNTELTVRYTIFDAIGLKSIKVYVDGEILEEITDFSADFNNYEGSFTLEESEAERVIRIVVEDLAGNVTDTDAEDFSSAYEFNSQVTVTTNAFVRFMANKPLFYGSIAGVIGVAGVAGFGISKGFKKKAE